MRLRVADRIFAAIAGVLILALCAGIVAQVFFQVDVIGKVQQILANESTVIRAALIVFCVFLVLLGGYCVFILFRHRSRRDKYILQRNDSGELAISLDTLESMVEKCLEQHPEIHIQHMNLENEKDGLLIRLRGGVAAGISIPLTVEALQRQIKQYVTACSGIEIKGIRVQIETMESEAENAPFVIAPPTSKPLLKEGTERLAETENAEISQAPQADQASEQAGSETGADAQAGTPAQTSAQPAAAPARPAPIPIPDDDDDRPLHQRLFSPQPEPCIVPEPPAGSQNEEVNEISDDDLSGGEISGEDVSGEEAAGDESVRETTEEMSGDEISGEKIPDEEFSENESLK